MTTSQAPGSTDKLNELRESAYRFRYGMEQLSRAFKDWATQLRESRDAELDAMAKARKAHNKKRAEERLEFEAGYLQWKTDNNLS